MELLWIIVNVNVAYYRVAKTAGPLATYHVANCTDRPT